VFLTISEVVRSWGTPGVHRKEGQGEYNALGVNDCERSYADDSDHHVGARYKGGRDQEGVAGARGYDALRMWCLLRDRGFVARLGPR